MSKLFGWNSVTEMFETFVPSSKEGYTMAVISVSTILGFIGQRMGVGIDTMIAIFVLLIVEFASGVYCSLAIRKEAFKSTKMWRFVVKAGLFVLIIYCLNQLHLEFQDKNITGELFLYSYNFIFSFSLLEMVISILEHYAEIQGKAKNYYAAILRTFIKKYFNNESKKLIDSADDAVNTELLDRTKSEDKAEQD